MCILLQHAPSGALQAVHAKFSQPKFQSVAKLTFDRHASCDETGKRRPHKRALALRGVKRTIAKRSEKSSRSDVGMKLSSSKVRSIQQRLSLLAHHGMEDKENVQANLNRLRRQRKR